MGKLQGRAEWHSSQRCLATRGHFTTQPVYTLFAVWRSCVLGAADTWLGYISALVTKRHEPQGGNHGSRDFCQRRTPVIAEELICNLKPISGQIRFQPWGSRRLLASAKAPEITSRGSKSAWIRPDEERSVLLTLVQLEREFKMICLFNHVTLFHHQQI